ncbi:MAG: phage terminase large subunit [Candidatus Gastranaerophilales bacterium]|nr:phage terminase large subunit [Candidatus Gastranaerophilales bacterium]
MVNYKLLDKQKEFIEIPHNNPLDVAIYQGGYGSGKTWCGALLGIMLAKKYPGSRGLVGAREYELVRKTTLVTYLEHLELLGYKDGVHYDYNKVDKIIKFKNGSEILFSAFDDPEKFKSLNLHWAEIEEASQIDDASFKQLLGRLRNTYRGNDWKDFRYRLFGHTNPQSEKGWIWRRFVQKKQENYRLIIAPTTNNIYLPEHFIKSLKDNFDEEYYKINVLGEFGDYSSGLVVKNFTEENLKHFKYSPNLPLHITCDFNVDPMCWVLAYIDKDNVYYFDELVIEKTTTEQCIKEFLRRYPNHNAEIIINGDASGDNRTTQSEYTNYAIIRKILFNHGYDKKQVKFHLRDYNPPILNRIAAFNAKVRNSYGERHLFVDERRCKWLLYNLYNLSFKEGTSIVDVPTFSQIKNNRDSKFLEHPFDAASYLTEYYWRIK